MADTQQKLDAIAAREAAQKAPAEPWHAPLRAFHRALMANLPDGAIARVTDKATGLTAIAPREYAGDAHADMPPIEVPNGRYRVSGSDWVMEFRAGRLVKLVPVAPPQFGGRGVIAVPGELD